MSFSSSVYLQFTALSEFVSSHKPPWATPNTLGLVFYAINLILSLCMPFVISPNKYQAMDERDELEAEVSEIKWNDRDGWSRKLIEKKKQKIAALEKKIVRLQNWYSVANFLSMFLFLGMFCIVLLLYCLQ
ncbi:uncharacterized protein LOC113361055 [Papaver somniferum]|uniref:uncharacterized protein LOC113361055 n=1 Tax=Papaver somniferum TaxID=3469 RepID=UPI000E6F8238|nr:uncharacterized protein LOC113361055 [Papaver somniferum]